MVVADGRRRPRPDWRRLYRLADWLMLALCMQGLWVLGTLAGLVIFGIGPASVALADAWRSALRDIVESSRWQRFWRVWRQEVWRSQGVVLLPVMTLWPTVFWTLTTRSLPVAMALLVITCGLLLTLFFFPVAAAISPGEGVAGCWRLAVVLAWAAPGPTVLIGLGVVVLAIVALTVSSITWLLFVPSLPVLGAMWSGERTISRSQTDERDTPV